jgi:hypothetical protein
METKEDVKRVLKTILELVEAENLPDVSKTVLVKRTINEYLNSKEQWELTYTD